MRIPWLSLIAAVVVAPRLLAEAPPTAPALAFVRGQERENQISVLETLSAEYRPASGRGPSVWLVGVTHLGTREYYAAVQKRLDAQHAVLFEGVGGGQLQLGAVPDTSQGVQGQLAKALGLVFQLDAIDYQRPHFSNSDLTQEALNAALEKRASAEAAPGKAPEKNADAAAAAADACSQVPAPSKVDEAMFEQLMGALKGEGEMAEQMRGIAALIGSTPEMRETTKLMLIEALAQAGELIEIAKAMSPEIKDLFEVLITERNAEVIRQLEHRLRTLPPDQSIAVFYGAAHMDEIAARLTKDLGYEPAAQHWDVAFAADGTKSMMPAAQMRLLMQMMRAQMQPNPSPANGASKLQPELPLLKLFEMPPAK
jgi:hypothetical protein